jgi:hypothetical protein
VSSHLSQFARLRAIPSGTGTDSHRCKSFP